MNTELLRFNEEAKFCVFDFETEDLNLYTTKPWQFASILCTQKKELRTQNRFLFWDDLAMSREAEMHTRFNRATWEPQAEDPLVVLEDMEKDFDEATIIAGHNILSFDINVYRRLCQRLGRKPLPIHYKAFDTLSCGKGIRMDYPYQRGSNFLSYQLKMMKKIPPKRGIASLAALAKYYEIPVDETKTHDALYDVSINKQVLFKELWEVEV